MRARATVDVGLLRHKKLRRGIRELGEDRLAADDDRVAAGNLRRRADHMLEIQPVRG
jgi:hypothetical protein